MHLPQVWGFNSYFGGGKTTPSPGTRSQNQETVVRGGGTPNSGAPVHRIARDLRLVARSSESDEAPELTGGGVGVREGDGGRGRLDGCEVHQGHTDATGHFQAIHRSEDQEMRRSGWNGLTADVEGQIAITRSARRC